MDQELKHKNADRIEVEVKKEVEYKLEMRMVRIKGLSVFSYNMKTGLVEKVGIKEKVAVDFTKTNKTVKKQEASHHADCIYVQALNMKNAKKKFTKMVTKAKEINSKSND